MILTAQCGLQFARVVLQVVTASVWRTRLR
jgi:hypothetical protein